MTRQVKAKLRFLRMGPRKVRLVADLIRNKKAVEAERVLMLLKKRAAKPMLKLLQSAMANAKNNFSLPTEDLKIATLMVDEGPTLKRWMPRARGRATPLRLRSSHITLILTGEDKEADKASGTKKIKADSKKPDSKKEDKKSETKKVATKAKPVAVTKGKKIEKKPSLKKKDK